MTIDWYEHPEAREELLEAHARYAGIDDGRLGEDFLIAVESAVDLITRWPEAPPPYLGALRHPPIRALRLSRFPYHLVFAVIDGRIIVLAYAHDARRPGYWAGRIGR